MDLLSTFPRLPLAGGTLCLGVLPFVTPETGQASHEASASEPPAIEKDLKLACGQPISGTCVTSALSAARSIGSHRRRIYACKFAKRAS